MTTNAGLQFRDCTIMPAITADTRCPLGSDSEVVASPSYARFTLRSGGTVSLRGEYHLTTVLCITAKRLLEVT
jgi:hypothetical protein